MRSSETPGPERALRRFEISHDAGRTWQPMPRGWQQGGRFTEGPDGIAIQSVGRGREVWYRVVERESRDDG